MQIMTTTGIGLLVSSLIGLIVLNCLDTKI